MAAPAIVVEDLSFRYAGRRRPALSGVSFAVAPGETLLVLGPSGCGKSTLTLCLNGLIPHSVAGELGGRVLVAGRDTRETPVAELARSVGLVFQDPDAQFCMLRVDDEIAFGLENLRVPPAEMPARIRQALDLVGLAGHERARVDRLSGGARQRLALAGVLALEPAILVFDEATSNLDPAGAEEVFARIAALKVAGDRTIVIVEHRLDHLMHLVDRVLVLGPEGTPLALGPPARVLRDHAADLDRFGIWIPQVSELANRLIARGLDLPAYPTTVDEAEEAIEAILAPSPPNPLPHQGGGGAGLPPSPVGSRPTDLGPTAPSKGGTQLPSPLVGEGRGERGNVPPSIDISHLSWLYPSGEEALRDVSLAIPEGSFFAIVGPNGAGKSTLGSHVIGSIRPEAGAVRLFEQDARDLPAMALTRLIGYVFQNPEHQFVAGTVSEELAFGLRARGASDAEVRERVEAMLAAFGLETLAKANPFTLSHGEKRRLSVAAMLILEPRILVLDEPTFGQDRQNTAMLLAKLVELNRAGRTIVMITHDLRLVAQHAHAVAVLVAGSVAYTGSVPGLFSDADLLRQARLGLPPLLELSRRLARRDPTFPDLATVEDPAEAIAERMRVSIASKLAPPLPFPLEREQDGAARGGGPLPPLPGGEGTGSAPAVELVPNASERARNGQIVSGSGESVRAGERRP